MYSFRIRVNVAPALGLNSPASAIELSRNPDLRLTSATPNKAIEHADRWSLIGSGYEDTDAAQRAGGQYRDAFAVALARVGVAVDFGDRASGGSVVTAAGLAMLGQRDTPTLNDTHGLMVFPTAPSPQFVSMTASVTSRIAAEPFEQAFAKAIANAPKLSDHERVAYDLFNASGFQESIDTTFLLLVMAAEVLIDTTKRPQNVVAHVDRLLELTRQSELPDGEKNSLLSSLGSLKEESIGQAGRRLAKSRLAGRKFDGLEPDAFFAKCYSLRSSLVHGNVPLPTARDLGEPLPALKAFVSDLLTSPHIGPP